jgi:hypothetical protein
MPEPMMTVDRPAAVSGGKMVDLGTEPQIASAATLMASIGRLSGLVGRIEQAQAKGKWPGVRLSGVTSDTQHSQTSRDPVRLLMVSAANSTDEFLAEVRPLLEGAWFEQAELVFVILPELNKSLIQQMGRFIARRVLIEPLSSSAASELRASPDDATRGRRAGSALDRELAMLQGFYQPLAVSSLVRLHEAYAIYLNAVGPPSSCRVWTTRCKGK